MGIPAPRGSGPSFMPLKLSISSALSRVFCVILEIVHYAINRNVGEKVAVGGEGTME